MTLDKILNYSKKTLYTITGTTFFVGSMFLMSSGFGPYDQRRAYYNGFFASTETYAKIEAVNKDFDGRWDTISNNRIWKNLSLPEKEALWNRMSEDKKQLLSLYQLPEYKEHMLRINAERKAETKDMFWGFGLFAASFIPLLGVGGIEKYQDKRKKRLENNI